VSMSATVRFPFQFIVLVKYVLWCPSDGVFFIFTWQATIHLAVATPLVVNVCEHLVGCRFLQES
jgi:hypothetical protein